MESLYRRSDYVGWIPCLSGKLICTYAQAGIGENKRTCNLKESQILAMSSDVNWLNVFAMQTRWYPSKGLGEVVMFLLAC